MTKAIYLGQTNRVSADNQHLARVGRKIFVGFIAIFPAILVKIKWVVAKIRKMIGAYDQRVFWAGNFVCLGVTTLALITLAKEHWATQDREPLLFLSGFIFFLFYALILPMAKKDANGQTNWL